MQYIVQPVLEKGANHPTFSVNTAKTYAIGSVQSKFVLQANGTTLTQASWSESTSGQRWKLQRQSSGRYKICCASVPDYCLEGSTAGGAVKIASSSTSEAQTWELVPMGGAIYHIRSSTQGQVLAESNGTFILAPEHIPADDSAEEAQKHPEQRFVLAEVQPNALADTYSKTISLFSSAGFGGEQRDVALGKYDNGVPGERQWRLRNLESRDTLALYTGADRSDHPARAGLWMHNEKDWKQRFTIEHVKDNLYRFVERETGEILAARYTNDWYVFGFAANNVPANEHLWEIRPQQGCFKIFLAGTNKVMHHQNEANQEWIRLVEDSPDGGDLNRWILEDETAWEADATKEYKIYNPTAEKWLHAMSESEPRLGDWEDTSRQLWRLAKLERTADGRQIYSVASTAFPGRALSMPNVANDSPLTLGGANSIWHVALVDDGAFRLRAEGVGGSDRYDMSTRGPEDSANLVTAYVEVWNEHQGNQEWALVDRRECTVEPGKRYLILTENGLALTDEPRDGTTTGVVKEQECTNRPEQFWRFEHDAVSNAYFIVNMSTNRVIEVQNKSTADNAPLQTSTAREQRWRIDFVSTNKYTLTADHSGKILDAAGMVTGCHPVQWAAVEGAPNQKWRVVEMHDGRVISPEGLVPLDFSPVAIQSLRIPSGLRVTLYDGPHLSGSSKVLLADTSDIGAFHVVSMVVEPIATLRTASGVAGHLGIGEYTTKALSDLGINVAGLTSIDVPQGMQVELFSADDFYGEQRVLSFGAPPLADAGVTTVASIRVKAAGVVVPRETLRYGDIITLHSQRKDYHQLTVDDGSVFVVAWGNGGPQTQFRIVRAGATRFKDLVCYGDVVGLQSLYNDQYVYIDADHEQTKHDILSCEDARAKFTLVRAAAGTSRSFVSRGDVLAFFEAAHSWYLSANNIGTTQHLKPMDHLEAWEGWKIQHVWPVDAAGTGTWSAPVDGSTTTTRSAPLEEGAALVEDGSEQRRAGKAKGAAGAEQGRGAAVRADRARDAHPAREGRRVASVEPVLSSGSLARSLPGSFSPLRFTGARSGSEAFETRLYCGEDACGAAACFADGGMLSVCGAAATGIGFCGVDIAAVGVCGLAASLQAICGIDVAGVGLCAVAASGVAVCGADFCGAAACGAAACGGAACGAAACGANAGNGPCGVDACSVDGSIISACPADICAANACLINLCPADACAADACLIDLIPIIPGI